jgi:hypothetical protein
MYDAAEPRRGIGYKLTPTKPNRQGWSSTVSIHNKTAAGAIVETAGRKSGMTGNFSPRFSGFISQAAARCKAAPCLRLMTEDQGKPRLE